MPTILTCTDGSIYSGSVYDYTAWAAARLRQAWVQVLHVIETPVEWIPSADFSGAIGVDAAAALSAELAALDAERARVEEVRSNAILAEARRRLQAAGVTGVSTFTRHGSLPMALEELEGGVDLIIMGKRGEGADFEKGFLGSQLEQLIRASNRPVLVAARAFKPVERFLLAFDGGPSSFKAADFIINSPLLQGLECHVVMVAPPGSPHQDAFEGTVARLRDAGYSVKATIIPEGEPHEVLASETSSRGIDLLVMGAYGHSRLRQFFVGSTTTKTVKSCRIPVLMFR